MEATKYDEDKPRMSNIPGSVLMDICKVFNYGEVKYGKYNYRMGMDHTRYYDACMRHLTSWFDNEDIDLESGLQHLDHALCSLIMLKANINDGVGVDNRYKKCISKPKVTDIETLTCASVRDITKGVKIGIVNDDDMITVGTVCNISSLYRRDDDKIWVINGTYIRQDDLSIEEFMLQDGDSHIVLMK